MVIRECERVCFCCLVWACCVDEGEGVGEEVVVVVVLVLVLCVVNYLVCVLS